MPRMLGAPANPLSPHHPRITTVLDKKMQQCMEQPEESYTHSPVEGFLKAWEP